MSLPIWTSRSALRREAAAERTVETNRMALSLHQPPSPEEAAVPEGRGKVDSRSHGDTLDPGEASMSMTIVLQSAHQFVAFAPWFGSLVATTGHSRNEANGLFSARYSILASGP